MRCLILLLLFFILTQTDRLDSSHVFRDLKQLEDHSQSIADRFLQDAELQKSFPISDYFYPSTRFWFLIYTYFDDAKIVIHDRNNLNLIYHVQDFTSLDHKNVHPYAQSYIQDELIKKQMKSLKEKLLLLANDPLPKEAALVSLYNQVVKAGVVIGKTPHERKKTFALLAKGLRAQRGLKNHIQDGISRYNLYSQFLDQYFEASRLPKELIAIAFLESSFNPHAHSKSRAAGVWQLMPFLQKKFFPVHKGIDYRLNIGLSSIAAASLLKENYQILKRWDLAITAYNSGIKHIIKEKRLKPELNLEELIKSSEHSRFGFASKNFYAEYLALTRVLKFREQLFPTTQAIDPIQELYFYFSKCDLNLKRIHSTTDQEYLRSLNHQLKKLKILKKGVLISSDSKLPSRYYEQISIRDLIRKRPKDWMNRRKNYSCSTR
ncbi:MAG TPA: transglycosylase SLT domain-containing protein [Bacteriovoracaceae bacterium]|nr:transglycosylase SLT domain-containing protein [Bacteriovoracaceae bacterium]